MMRRLTFNMILGAYICCPLYLSSQALSANQNLPISYGQLRPRDSAEETNASSVSVSQLSTKRVKPACVLPPPPVLPVEFTIEYRAYIPYDNVQGNPSAYCATVHLQTYAVYAGDQRHDSDTTTYRTSIYSIMEPGIGTAYDQVPDTGITYQFSPPSPVNGSYLTTADFDSKPGTCYKYNAEAQAKFGSEGSETITPAVVNSTTSSFTYNGKIENPLGTPLLYIGWNVKTTIEKESGYGNVKVSGDVTCFPAHYIMVDGINVASYTPTTNTKTYIAGCLLGPDSTPLSGPATSSNGYNISY